MLVPGDEVHAGRHYGLVLHCDDERQQLTIRIRECGPSGRYLGDVLVSMSILTGELSALADHLNEQPRPPEDDIEDLP